MDFFPYLYVQYLLSSYSMLVDRTLMISVHDGNEWKINRSVYLQVIIICNIDAAVFHFSLCVCACINI